MTTLELPRIIARLVVCCMGLHLAIAVPSDATCPAAETVDSPDASQRGAAPAEGFTHLGKISPRHARDIKSSNWAVGAETMGREYTIYANWKKYLGPLGAKRARIQSGWAKTEQEKGKYDWAWLDEIIPDMIEQGVQPWVCLCYGNPIYPGGGGTGLGGGLPSTPEAKKAWETFVDAFVERYGDQISEWEVWNEPKGGVKGVPGYADLVIRTAEVIRKRQQKAQIMVAAGGSFDIAFVDKLLDLLKKQGKLHLVDQVVYHPYSYNPDSVYGRVAELRKVVASYSGKITIRQDENGAPSQGGSFGALAKHDWTEEYQAKWALRRLMGDLGRDIPSSYFAICDMVYLVTDSGRDSDLRQGKEEVRKKINFKGLLAANPDKTIDHAKVAYRAVQQITAIFDDTIKRIDGYDCQVSVGKKSGYSTFGYRAADGGQIVTIWRDSDKPGTRPEKELLTVTIADGRFKQPVWVDMLSGEVHKIPDSAWQSQGSQVTFQNIPVYDHVVLIAEQIAIPLEPAKQD